MMIIGLTGGFASGKTTVAGMFKNKLALVIDADCLAHQLMRPKTKIYNAIVKHFGREILAEGNKINRKKLAASVFKNKKELNRLVGIIHPAVITEVKKLIKKYKRQLPKKIVILDAPLLIESRLHLLADKLVVVKCSTATQIARAKAKMNLSRNEIISRINSQLPLYKKIKLADFTIDNEGSLSETKKQVLRIYKELALDIKDVKGQIRPDDTSGLIQGGRLWI